MPSRKPRTSRRTPQREAVLKVIRAARGPITVEQIQARARRSAPTIGTATVYRTINLLIESGEVHSVVLGDGVTRYEPTDRGHHHHFRCRACERVFDLEECPVELPRNAVLAGGYLVEDHEVTLYGLCPSCRTG